ncbi:unnamed protein product [Pleuronectes platessa]|uniref:Uncharacterized protein n=1 Tax=Pleuronectes platessa TaxID=8262 RepID=A0A9N7VU30_PLEPL|nr:unnamed protein product [Pleuronectes platessa]
MKQIENEFDASEFPHMVSSAGRHKRDHRPNTSLRDQGGAEGRSQGSGGRLVLSESLVQPLGPRAAAGNPPWFCSFRSECEEVHTRFSSVTGSTRFSLNQQTRPGLVPAGGNLLSHEQRSSSLELSSGTFSRERLQKGEESDPSELREILSQVLESSRGGACRAAGGGTKIIVVVYSSSTPASALSTRSDEGLRRTSGVHRGRLHWSIELYEKVTLLQELQDDWISEERRGRDLEEQTGQRVVEDEDVLT